MIMIGWIGENAMFIGLFFMTHTASKQYFSKFHTFIDPSYPPVANKQYLGEAAAQINSSWQSLISLTIMNSLVSILS